jgi:hypothetical protein
VFFVAFEAFVKQKKNNLEAQKLNMSDKIALS